MEETESRVINLEQLCRLCLHEKRILIDIYESSGDELTLNLEQKIKACATVNLSKNDGLPNRICIPCLSSLNAAFEFRIQCENADKTLRDILQRLIDEQIKKETAGRVNEEIESREEQNVEFNDLDHVIFIKEDDNIEDDQQEDDYLYLKNEELTESILVDEIITEDEIKSDSIVLPIQTKKPNPTEKIAPRVVVKKTTEKPKAKYQEETKKACPFCNKMLTRVNEHIRLLHRNKVYVCKKSDCGAEFLTLKNLQSHQLKCYNMEKPYKCLRCNKEFYRKCNYKAHIVRHSDKKAFQCQLCDKAFVDSTGLKRHFLKHHELFQETFISDCCGKKFKTKEGLKQHIQKGVCGVHVFQVLQQN